MFLVMFSSLLKKVADANFVCAKVAGTLLCAVADPEMAFNPLQATAHGMCLLLWLRP